MFDKLTEIAAADPTMLWAARFDELSINLEIEDGETHLLQTGPNGISVRSGEAADADMRLTAPQKVWDAFRSACPPVGFHSLGAMLAGGHMKMTAKEPVKRFQNLLLLEKLLASTRNVKPASVAPYEETAIEPVVGRYLRINLQGRPHRIYFEEAGEGVPLICLHTAGADGRQYRALMNDAEITKNFRVIAFDLPRHGKSSPPPGFESEQYLLTTQVYVDTIMAVKEALALDQPVVMGCSIGGRAVLHLALQHGNAFKAAIGLQSAMHAEAESPHESGPGLAQLFPFHRPDVHGGETSAASMISLISPNTPSNEKWETLWHYMQGGPGVFPGDLYYYFVDGDLRNGLIDGLDAEECPLYLLTGEYDISATPAMTEELAKAVNATHFEVMKGLGHFPMSEDPQAFRNYLLPVLDKVLAQSA